MVMRPIRPKSSIAIREDEFWNGELSEKHLEDILDPILLSRTNMFESVSSIERTIDHLLIKYFLGDWNDEEKVRFERFQYEILASEWCTFSTKRKLIIKMINEENLLSGREKEDFDKLLKKVMSYRNRFAHGEFSTNGQSIFISFFENKHQTDEVDQEYLWNIERI